MSDLLDAAINYCREGFSVIPIQPSRKKPLLPWVEYTEQRADEETIRKWWSDWPDANIGIVTGKVSGIVVIDVDLDGEGEAARIYEDSPTGRISQTGSGGYHLYYRYPDGTVHVPNKVNLLPGIDVRADGGYVVAPPSIHTSGRRYVWHRQEDMAPLSRTMLDRIVSKDPKEPKKDEDAWISDLLRGSHYGSRNDSCARLAGYFAGKDIPQDVVQYMLLQWNTQNDPPLAKHEIAATVESIYKTARRREERAAKENSNLFDVVDFQSYMIKYGGAEINWMIQDWLPEDTIAFVVAPPGTFKTWLLLDLAVSVATGTPFLGECPVQESGPVLLVQQEDFHGSIAERIALIVASRYPQLRFDDDGEEEFVFEPPPNPPIYIHPDRNLHFADAVVMDMLEQRIKEIRPKLIIIDPLYSAGSTDDYMAKTAEQMLPLKRLRDEYGCSFVIAHHTGKRAEGTTREGLWGSQFLNALLETGWQVRQGDDNRSILVKRHFKVTDNPPDLKVEFNISSVKPYQYEPRILGETSEMDDLSTGSDIVTLLQDEGPLTAKEMAEKLGISRSTVNRKLKALRSDGMIDRDGAHRYHLTGDMPTF